MRDALATVDLVVPHTDADGLAAGAIALRARDWGVDRALLLPRGATPFGPDAPLPPATSVAVLDWGVRRVERPGLLVDHHAPEGLEPRADQVVLSGYGEVPEVCTAVLMRRLVPEAPAWVCAVGAVGDLGDAAWRHPECAGVPKSPVRELVPLINAPRRLPEGPVATSLALLVEHESARAALADPRTEELRAARAEWRGGLDRAMRVPPRLADRVALVRFRSPYQIHPLVATAWARRLAPRVVLAANDDYLPGRVNFAVRGGDGDLRRLLRDALPDEPGEFAHGHDRATGGSLTPDRFAALLQALGSDLPLAA